MGILELTGSPILENPFVPFLIRHKRQRRERERREREKRGEGEREREKPSKD
jgi:hypothetical protein